MKFEDALIDLKKGRKIRMTSWDHGDFVYLDDKKNLRDENGELTGVCPTWLCEEWEVIIEKTISSSVLNMLIPFPKLPTEIKIADLQKRIDELEQKIKCIQEEYNQRIYTLELKHWVGIGRYYP